MRVRTIWSFKAGGRALRSEEDQRKIAWRDEDDRGDGGGRKEDRWSKIATVAKEKHK